MAPNPDTGCRECDFLLSRYEAATFSLMRVHNALRNAEALRDFESVQHLSADAHDISLRRKKAKEGYAEHRARVHGKPSDAVDYAADLDSIIDVVSSHA